MSAPHVVVLAAGEGKRMHSDRPKVLHELAGRPLLEHVLAAAEVLGAGGVHVVYGHGGEQVPEAFADRAIHWVRQAEQLGTGHAVAQAMPGVPDGVPVLVLYGDVPLVAPDMLQRTVAEAAAGRVGLVTVALDDPGGYGRIRRDDAGAVVGIVEHRDATPEQRALTEINTGILAVPAALLRRWLGDLDNANAQGEYYLTDVVAAAVAEGVAVRTVSPAAPEEVMGVNDRVQLAWLERYAQRRMVEALMRGGSTVADPARVDVRGEVTTGRDCFIDVNVVLEGRVTLGNGVRLGPGALVRDAVLGDGTEVLAHSVVDGAQVGAGCRLGPFARVRPGTRLSDEVHIGNFVETKNSSVGKGSKANHLTYVGDSDVGSRVNIGAGTITCNFDGASKHRTRIGDDVFVGSGVELVAPVELHDGATIGAGSTITTDAPPGALTLTRARQSTIGRWRRPRKQPK